jgi:tetratricopeptide (TPR) repeat protein
MSPDLDGLIAKAKALANESRYDEAISLATDLVQRYPNEMKVWSLRAYLYTFKNDFELAVADLTRAIDINDMEPVLLFDRGRYESRVGRFGAAVEDFGRGLALCDHYRDDYYRETLHFFRAEALIELGRKREALEDLSQVRDDFTSWTYKLRTKSELRAQRWLGARCAPRNSGVDVRPLSPGNGNEP